MACTRFECVAASLAGQEATSATLGRMVAFVGYWVKGAQVALTRENSDHGSLDSFDR
jgi:hypothetical protein